MLPAITPTLEAEVLCMGWQIVSLGGGYSRIDGAPYAILVAAIDEVCEAEQDEFLELFSRSRRPHGQGAEWLRQWLSEANMKQRNVKEMPGYEEMFQKLVEAMPLEKRLAGLDPAQRLAGLDPAEVMRSYAAKQRLAGLDPAQRLAGLDPAQRLAGLDPAQRLAGLDPAQRLAGLDPAQRLAGLDPAQRLAGLKMRGIN